MIIGVADPSVLRMVQVTRRRLVRWGHNAMAAGPKERRAAGNEISLEETKVPQRTIKFKEAVLVTSSDWIVTRISYVERTRGKGGG